MNKPISLQLNTFFHKANLNRGAVFGSILLAALFAFEVFNFSTTDFALTDLLSKDLTFGGIRWATILSIAFCGIDFAGIARLFTPEENPNQEPAEVWYLFGAWLLAAAMNAILTWWGVAVAINGHTTLGSAIIGREVLVKVVPVFVAIMVWLIRLLVIGTFSMAGDRLFSISPSRPDNRSAQGISNSSSRQFYQPTNPSLNPSLKPNRPISPQHIARPEPTYQPIGMAAKSQGENQLKYR